MAAYHYSLHYCEDCGASFMGGNKARWCEVHRAENRKKGRMAWYRRKQAETQDARRCQSHRLNGWPGVAAAMINCAVHDVRGVGMDGQMVNDKDRVEAREWLQDVGKEWLPIFGIDARVLEKV